MALKRIGEPNHVVQLIETYVADVERILAEILRHEENQKIDLHKLTPLARGIEDKSTRIGAELVKVACYNVIKACDENNHQKPDKSRILILASEHSNQLKGKRVRLGRVFSLEEREEGEGSDVGGTSNNIRHITRPSNDKAEMENGEELAYPREE
ncbi:hypothetical protein VIGAN_07072000 [Vigna angularis var. angularis]|uniref:Histidine-containing phosphotransfer protein n=1 Tax=Vigna angularis var. angularis TaxID=157739 RepID=A0A0S3SGV0_PHAAN|nr:hypothetical protein VIGAN_07072000 [Vigna angularis var. angularis]